MIRTFFCRPSSCLRSRGQLIRAMLALVAFVVFAPISLVAQTADTAILGTVLDSAGGAVANATVTLTQSATGLVKTAQTRADGSYEFRYLLPGQYVVEVKAAGFNAERRSGIDIQLAQQAKVDFSLQVGGVQQTIEVKATPPLLQTENASLGEVVGTERIENLPLNGRKFDDLAILTPGVQVYNPDLHSSSTDGSQIGGNGGRLIWGQVNVDGITMVNNRHNYVNLYPSVDAIQEFRVQTGNYSAEYGGNAGTNVNIQIKSGTNQFHGVLFEYLRNYAMDARNYFSPSPLPQNILKQNQYGATFGGPAIRDKTFFFLSYEGLRSIQESPGTSVVLTPQQRQGDFSVSSTPVINPTTGVQFPGNIIPPSQINPVSLNIINKYMPLPNTPGAVNYAGSALGDLTINHGIARVDQYFSQHDQLFVHYIHAFRNFPIRDLNPNFDFTGTYPIGNLSAQWIHTFSPAFINEFRAGYDRENVSQLSTLTNTGFTIESLGINGMKVGGPNGRPLGPNEEGFPLLNIAGYLGMGSDLAASNLDNSQTYQIVDNLSLVRGRHTLKTGFDLRKLYDNATTNNWPFGSISFTGDISGDAAAAYMLGYPRTTLTPEGVPITKARQWRSAVYIQDDWKVTPKLTLNLGARWDRFGIPIDENGVTRTLDWSQNPPQFYPAPGQKLNNIWDITNKDISPRFGFAYNPASNLVVRGGYGIFYFGGQFDNINILQLNPPTAGSLTITNPALNPIATIQNPIPAALYPSNPFFNAVTLPADRLHPDTYVQNWNLMFSKQFGANVLDVGYVGNKGTHVDSSFKNWNQPDPGPGDIQARRPYPDYARIRLQFYGANISYNSLQVRFERRLTKGLSLTAAYTWSHEIDDAWETTNSGGCGCQNPHDLGAERSSGVYDQRHNFVLGYVWQIPFANNLKGIAGAVAAGWSFEGILTLASGNPFDVLESFDSQNNDGLWERPNLVAGKRTSVSNQGPSLWFNTNAFTPSVFMYGNSPRNPVVGPGTKALNATLMKAFRMPWSEQQALEFRAEAFNAFNTPQFSNPDQYLGDTAFGQVTSTKLANRELQLALKYRF
jgi:outer membrane receptor protein involved in Fe transport